MSCNDACANNITKPCILLLYKRKHQQLCQLFLPSQIAWVVRFSFLHRVAWFYSILFSSIFVWFLRSESIPTYQVIPQIRCSVATSYRYFSCIPHFLYYVVYFNNNQSLTCAMHGKYTLKYLFKYIVFSKLFKRICMLTTSILFSFITTRVG